MIGQTRAEYLKIRSTRTTLYLVIAMVVLVLLQVVLGGTLGKTAALAIASNERAILGAGHVAVVFAALAGALVVTSEYRFGTIRPTLLVNPKRSQVVGAKLAASVLAGLSFGLLAEGLALPIGAAFIAGRHVPLALSAHELALLAIGTLVSAALAGAFGVGFALIVTNQVGTIIGLLAWMFVIDNLVFGLAPSVGRFLPSQASAALSGMREQHLLSPGVGGAIFLAWVVALAVAGHALVRRRDIV